MPRYKVHSAGYVKVGLHDLRLSDQIHCRAATQGPKDPRLSACLVVASALALGWGLDATALTEGTVIDTTRNNQAIRNVALSSGIENTCHRWRT